MDALGDGRFARCVVQWFSRGLKGRSKIDRGLEGVRMILGQHGDNKISLVPLSDVLDVKTTFNRPVVNDKSATDPTLNLPFNLSLTEAQRAARETVVLPFSPAAGGGAAIIYEPDSADDIDEEDPDD